VHSIRNEDGEYIEKSRKPMALLEIPVPFELKAEDILRRAR
jgi:putative protease